jgi:hypothetical protein
MKTRIRESQKLVNQYTEVKRKIKKIKEESVTISDLAEVSMFDGVYGF